MLQGFYFCEKVAFGLAYFLRGGLFAPVPVVQVAGVEQADALQVYQAPSLNTLTINSMTTADSVLVPIQCEYYALEGLSQLIYTINLVKDRLNPKLTINGVVFTMYDGRTNLSMQVIENVRNNLNQTIYDTIIPRGVRLAEAPSHGLPITQYDNRSTGAKAYMALAKEVIERSAK